jgi:hypothetical protein
MTKIQLSHILLFAFVLLFASTGLAQDAAVVGFVKDKQTGEPVIFASVVLVGTNYGVSTDVNGYYTLSKIEPGIYTLKASSLEYKEQKIEVTLTEGKLITRNLFLDKNVIQLGGAEISADKQEHKTQVKMSVETIRPADIKKIPSFGGQADIVQVLQVLPGFVSTGDQGGQLYIRGGSPVQNKVLLDGMIVYNAFHSIGLFSVFDSDVIANADVYTGGFSAEFGGRISSIMDITTRDGNKNKVSGKIGASPFGAKILVEGPLQKISDTGGGISYILSLKHSYLEQSSKVLYNYIDEDGLPFNFTDAYGKLSFASKSGSKFNLYGFSFSDDVKYLALSNLNWVNNGGGGNFVVVPAGSPVLINGHFAASTYKVRLAEEGLKDRSSSVDGFNFGLDFKYVLGDDDLRYGVEVVGMKTNFQTFNSLGVSLEQEENTTELAAYLVYKISKGKFLVEPSFRLQYYSSLAQMRPEPRIGVKYKATPRLRIKAAAGMYSQNLIAANSDRDVVNLFYGFLSGPENLQDEFFTSDGTERDVTHSLQTANHLIFGFEYDITEKISVNIEGYLKSFTQLTNLNRNKLFPDDADNAARPDALKKDFIIESGIAQGVDFVLKYEDKHTYLWFVYSLGNVDRWDGFQWYDPVFDRRHNINFVASQAFGETKTWEASLRWNLGSGLPFTQTQGFYQPPNVNEGIGTDYVVNNANELGIQYGGLNEGRLPVYHRLDISVRKTIQLDKNRILEFNGGVTNVYSRENIFYVNRVTNEEVYQLPFLPSLGADFTF